MEFRGRVMSRMEQEFMVQKEGQEPQVVRGWTIQVDGQGDPTEQRLCLQGAVFQTFDRAVADAYEVGKVYPFQAPDVKPAPRLVVPGAN